MGAYGRTAIAVAAAAAALGASACGRSADTFAYSGTVQTDSAAVGSTAGGRVTAVPVRDGQLVHKGDVIVRFDDRQQRASYQTAIAQQQAAVAALHDLEAGPRQADIDKAAAAAAQADAAYRQAQLEQPQNVESARSSMTAASADAGAAHEQAYKADRDLVRAKQLFDEGAISAQDLDAARAAQASAASAAQGADSKFRAARTQFQAVQRGSAAQTVSQAANAAAAADANLALIRAGSRPGTIAQARATANASTAAAAGAAARLDETRVIAPADGIIDGLDLHVGDLVAAGAPVARVDEFGEPWVRIYVTQSDMARVKIGAAMRIRSDALAGRAFDGIVEAIDAQAQFTPRDVQTAEDRADLAFGVKVRIHDPEHVLRAGTTVAVALP